MKTTFLIALAMAIPLSSSAANQMIENLKSAPEALCAGNPQYPQCLAAAKRTISATYRVTKAGTLCEQNKENLHRLGKNVQKQCSDFSEAMTYMESLNK